jgi:hypothetical protein
LQYVIHDYRNNHDRTEYFMIKQTSHYALRFIEWALVGVEEK